MARRTRAPARQRRATQQGRQRGATPTARKRARNNAGKPPAPRRYNGAPELLAAARDRFENSKDTVPAIAADLGCTPQCVYKIAKRENWVRYAPPPRTLPRGLQLLTQAEALEKQMAGWRGETPAADETVPDDKQITVAINQLLNAVLAEIAKVEGLCAGGGPTTPTAAIQTSRALATLTQAMHKLQQMQCRVPQTGLSDDDDIPQDIDEFREALARRIEAFMESRPDEDFAEEPAAASPDQA